MVKYREKKGVDLNGEGRENENPQMSNYLRIMKIRVNKMKIK